MGAQRIVVLAISAVSLFAVGIAAMSWQIQRTAPGANDSATYNDSYELGTGVTEGMGNVLGVGLPVILGVAAVATAFGLVLLAYRSGGR